MLTRIDVLLFAAARDLIGRDSLAIDLDLPASAGAVLQAVCVAAPQLAPLATASRLAVNRSYVDGSARIEAGDEIALIPPVSGG